jgi:hypothetical protein
MSEPRPRRRRRAVGPAGAPDADEPVLDLEPEPREAARDDDERLRADLPPHHDRGV